MCWTRHFSLFTKNFFFGFFSKFLYEKKNETILIVGFRLFFLKRHGCQSVLDVWVCLSERCSQTFFFLRCSTRRKKKYLLHPYQKFLLQFCTFCSHLFCNFLVLFSVWKLIFFSSSPRRLLLHSYPIGAKTVNNNKNNKAKKVPDRNVNDLVLLFLPYSRQTTSFFLMRSRYTQSNSPKKKTSRGTHPRIFFAYLIKQWLRMQIAMRFNKC